MSSPKPETVVLLVSPTENYYPPSLHSRFPSLAFPETTPDEALAFFGGVKNAVDIVVMPSWWIAEGRQIRCHQLITHLRELKEDILVCVIVKDQASREPAFQDGADATAVGVYGKLVDALQKLLGVLHPVG